jgi:pentatricopeptide repeat protein
MMLLLMVESSQTARTAHTWLHIHRRHPACIRGFLCMHDHMMRARVAQYTALLCIRSICVYSLVWPLQGHHRWNTQRYATATTITPTTTDLWEPDQYAARLRAFILTEKSCACRLVIDEPSCGNESPLAYALNKHLTQLYRCGNLAMLLREFETTVWNATDPQQPAGLSMVTFNIVMKALIHARSYKAMFALLRYMKRTGLEPRLDTMHTILQSLMDVSNSCSVMRCNQSAH